MYRNNIKKIALFVLKISIQILWPSSELEHRHFTKKDHCLDYLLSLAYKNGVRLSL